MATHAPTTLKSQRPERQPIDPRGPRFGAGITTVVLALIIALGPESGLSGLLLAIQILVFAAGAVLGMQAHPYGILFRELVRPRLAPPTELEEQAPPRFAQAVGLAFAFLAAAGLLLDLPLLFYVPLGFALAAAFLNAAFNFCLGCEVYLLIVRTKSASR